MRHKEGQLADYNLAMDKARVSTDPGELSSYIEEFEMKNKQFAAEIDNIFVKKKLTDESTRQVEEEINLLHHEAEAKINKLEPQKLQRYKALVDRSHQLRAQEDQAQQVLDQILAQIQEIEGGSSRHPSYADEYNAAMKKRARTQKEVRNLMQELEICEMPDPREANARLKDRVEHQSRDLTQLGSVTRDLKDRIKAAQKQLQDLTEELTDRKGDQGGDKRNYEKLRQRDDEMTEFDNKFEETRNSTVADQQATQENIVALLEHISQGLEQQNSMPSQQRLREMREEATFKERQLETSQSTMKRLLFEKKQREDDLAKLNDLDGRIDKEMQALDANMAAMRSDMLEFEDIDGLRHRASRTVQHLSRLLKDYQGRRDSVKDQVTQLQTKYEGLKSKIHASDTAKTLSTLEAKLRTYAQNIFHLQEFVETKSRETDFKATKATCFSILDKLNAHAKSHSAL